MPEIWSESFCQNCTNQKTLETLVIADVWAKVSRMKAGLDGTRGSTRRGWRRVGRFLASRGVLRQQLMYLSSLPLLRAGLGHLERWENRHEDEHVNTVCLEGFSCSHECLLAQSSADSKEDSLVERKCVWFAYWIMVGARKGHIGTRGPEWKR